MFDNFLKEVLEKKIKESDYDEEDLKIVNNLLNYIASK